MLYVACFLVPAAPGPPFLLAVTLWGDWGKNQTSGQARPQGTASLQGTALWKYFHDPRGKCWSLSDVKLAQPTTLFSRRMLQSASVVLLKAFVRTDYKDLQNHMWKKPEGLLCREDIVDENPRSEEKWKVKVSMKSGFGLQLTASSPAFRGKWPPVDRGKNWIFTWDGRKLNGDQNNAAECSRCVGELYLRTGLSKALVRSLQLWAFSICLLQYCS